MANYQLKESDKKMKTEIFWKKQQEIKKVHSFARIVEEMSEYLEQKKAFEEQAKKLLLIRMKNRIEVIKSNSMWLKRHNKQAALSKTQEIQCIFKKNVYKYLWFPDRISKV